MGLTNLDTALLDLIPSDCKLCIERSFGFRFEDGSLSRVYAML